MKRKQVCLSGATPEVIEINQSGFPRLEGVRLLFLTDLHYGKWMRDGATARVMEQAMSLRPDLIVLGGDLAENERDEERLAKRHLRGLKARLGVFCVPGNNDHEAFNGQYARFRRVLADAGVRLLVNERAHVGALALTGLDESKYGHPDPAPLALPVEPGDFHLLVTHSPWALDRVLGRGEKVDMALCGHTHGGQMALGRFSPFAMGYDHRAIATRKYFFITGEHEVDGTRVIVSNGIGCSLLPLRVGAPPQLHRMTFGKSD